MIRGAWLAACVALGCGAQDGSGEGPAAVDVAAGDGHACLLRSDGTVRCWGANDFGQLGDGTRTARPEPVEVVGAPPDVAQIDAQGNDTCALTAAGEVWCWGQNHRGQLGDGTLEVRDRPTRVEGLPPAAGLSVGGAHVCALAAAGEVWCWGWNAPGQLGDGSTEDRTRPVRASSAPPGVVTVEAGYDVSCALEGGGRLSCWGYEPDRPPGSVEGVRAVANGADHTCAAVESEVRCWGHEPGGLAVPIDGDRSYLVPGARRVAAAVDHVCAVTDAGEVWCWGKNDHGQLGDGSYRWSTEPVRAELGEPASSVAVGARHSCALTRTGGVRCWGANDLGQLGDGTGFESLVPVAPD